MRPTPLIIITHEFFPHRGGIATYVEEIASAAANLGQDVVVWAQSIPNDVLEKAWKFKVKRLRLTGSHDLSDQVKLAKELIIHRRQLRNATVYLTEPGPMFTLMWLQFFSAFRPKHILLTFHGSEVLKFHRNPIIRPLARRLIRHAEAITTLTDYTRNLLSKKFPEASRKTAIVPGALRASFFASQATTKSKSDRIVILTVGRLHPRKGQLQTMAALAELPPAVRSNIEYWLVGTAKKGDYPERLKQCADRAGLNVKFLGELADDQISSIYDQADIFALTSIEHKSSIEGFGLVYLEASAHGLPVIAHNIGGVSEAVKDGQTGLLIKPDQPSELTKAFSKLISDPELRNRLGTAGRTWARHNSWQRSAELLIDTIHSNSSP